MQHTATTYSHKNKREKAIEIWVRDALIIEREEQDAE